MTASFYDAIVLGTELAPLCCGALLSKRGFRVLVVGQQTPPPDYAVGDFRLPRRPFAMTAQRSPITRRVVSELGLSQILRRMASPISPAFQVAMPGHRFDVSSNIQELEREIEREFPEVKRSILEFHGLLLEQSKAIDRLFERDLSWPPESFLERRELQRFGNQIPFDREGRGQDVLSEFPEGHPFRLAIRSLVWFGSNGEPSGINQLQLSRLYASRHTATALDGGLSALQQHLIERIRSHSGDVRQAERAQEVIVRRSTATGIRLFGSDETIGGAVVIAGVDVSTLLRLCQYRDPFEQLFERIGEPRPRYYRYTLNIVIAREGVPEGMARDVYHIGHAPDGDGVEHFVHLQLSELDAKHRLITVEALLPARAVENRGGLLEDVRSRVLATTRQLIPFVDRHLVLLDSPHDGKPPEPAREGIETRIRPAEPRGPSTMPIVYAYPITAALGICAMPVRTPLRGLLMCNNQVAPWLGMEGQLLAACSAARVVSRGDRSKDWMRRRLWTKVEM